MRIKELKRRWEAWLKGLIFCLLLQIVSTGLYGQSNFDWQTLTDVSFKEKFDKEIEGYWLIPTFGKKLKTWNNKKVTLEGFFIPIDLDENFHVLSRYPYSSCFFCGAAGPESVVELQLDKNVAKRLTMDQRMKFEGILVLNKSDLDHCSYILKEAHPIGN